VHGSLYPYASAHAHVLAVLRDYVNDHAAFQLSIVEIKLWQFNKHCDREIYMQL
jgi:hypothetical protein